MRIEELTITDYLARLASADATPGGGAAAGLTGAQACALLSMAGNLSRGKRYADVSGQIDEIVSFCDSGRERLLALTAADADAFDAVMAALRAPRGTDEEKRARETRLADALRTAARVPLDIMRETMRLTTPASILAAIGNPQLVSDVGIALHLMAAACDSARLNVLINLRELEDAEFVERAHAELEALAEKFREERRVALLAIEEKLPGAADHSNV